MQASAATHAILARTTNAAAVAVLAIGLESNSRGVRAKCLQTLAARGDAASAELILANWDDLTDTDIRIVRENATALPVAVANGLAQRQNLHQSIRAAAALHLFDTLDALVGLAESDGDPSIIHAASGAIICMASEVGAGARADRNVQMVRGPMLISLVASVGRHGMHYNDSLVDAMLMASTWTDPPLRALLNADDETGAIVRERLRLSDHAGVIDLLTGYLKRRQLPPIVASCLTNRNEAIVGKSILAAVGPMPSASTREHLSSLGIPRSLIGGMSRMKSIDAAYCAAWVHVYAEGGRDDAMVLECMMAAIFDWPQRDVVTAVALALSRIDVPHVDTLMRAAVPLAKLLDEVAARQGSAAAEHPSLRESGACELDDLWARCLGSLIDLLGHEDVAVVKAARRLLTPLHADRMIARFDKLRARSRRRLGRIVLRIDPDAIQRVRDALRHPVLDRRLDAIASAGALAAVEMLSDSFVHIAREDHQSARIRAAEVMGDATDEITYGLLQEMLNLPESPVRDAAQLAISTRRSGDAAAGAMR